MIACVERWSRGAAALVVGLVVASPARGAEAPQAPAPPGVEPAVTRVLDQITANSLRGHLSFLASDRLQGRGTPSKGLDLAAEYIAAQFRRAGLEPVGDDGYFQTADWPYRAPDRDTFACEVKLGDATLRVSADEVSGAPTAALHLPPTAIVKVDPTDAAALKALTADRVGGKVVLSMAPAGGKAASPREAAVARMAFSSRMAELKAAAVIEVDDDPEAATGLRADGNRVRPGPPRFVLHSAALARDAADLPAGPTAATLRLDVGEPKPKTAKARNVVGLLKGSDPELSRTYVIVSAHYDHLGIGPRNAEGDRIFNGANDDASGTATVIEVAQALASGGYRPKRSILFLALYGEEHGMVGSRHYVAHPVVPLDQTVAALNLEQLGRTDDTDGPRVGAATVTGLEYSDLGATLQKAGAAVGVEVGKHPTKSDAYFGASDNVSFALEGIPAHTVSVAYNFPDYHGLDDEWDRIDYPNLARVGRMVALGLIHLADSPKAPAWNADNPKAVRFLKAAAEKRKR